MDFDFPNNGTYFAISNYQTWKITSPPTSTSPRPTVQTEQPQKLSWRLTSRMLLPRTPQRSDNPPPTRVATFLHMKFHEFSKQPRAVMEQCLQAHASDAKCSGNFTLVGTCRLGGHVLFPHQMIGIPPMELIDETFCSSWMAPAEIAGLHHHAPCGPTCRS